MDDRKRAESGEASDAAAGKTDAGTNAALQQQLQQQQLQLLQLQQQQLANMSPTELATMTQQMALFMMPMMPFMMPLNQQNSAVGSADASAASTTTSAASAAAFASPEAISGLVSPASSTDAFSSQSSPLSLLGSGQFGNLSTGTEEAPKRKRGRPPKKDVVARAKADAEKTLKQFPMWGYGLPMPFLPGFLPQGTAKDDASGVPGTDDQLGKDAGVPDVGLDKLGQSALAGAADVAKPAKKKSRGTGKPRGRPRTRPRPGEIIRRAKPPAIAPANYSVMYNYSLSNIAQKAAELSSDANAAASATHDDNRLNSLTSSLLSGDHE